MIKPADGDAETAQTTMTKSPSSEPSLKPQLVSVIDVISFLHHEEVRVWRGQIPPFR